MLQTRQFPVVAVAIHSYSARGGSLFGLHDQCGMVVCPGAGHGRCGFSNRRRGNHGIGVCKILRNASNIFKHIQKLFKHIKHVFESAGRVDQWTLPGLFVSLLW